MLIIKDFTNWLTESAGLVTEVTTPAAVKTLRADIVAGAPFNKWTVSKTYPTCMFNPKWELNTNGNEWLIQIDAYMFEAKPEGAAISAVAYMEELIATIPSTHPSAKNNSIPPYVSFKGNQPPTDLPAGTKLFDGNRTSNSVTSNGNAWGLNAVSGVIVQDAYAAYHDIATEDPSVTVDTYLGILNKSVKNATAIMQIGAKSATIAGYPVKQLKDNLPLAQVLVDKVKTLPSAVPASPVVKPG